MPTSEPPSSTSSGPTTSQITKTAKTIARLQALQPAEGYYLAFSGGKDSVTLKALADMAMVRYDAHMNLTGLDPPELLTFVHSYHPDVELLHPPQSFFQLLPKRGFPTRRSRWCCQALKERAYGRGRVVLTGIRWQESPRRANRPMVETCPYERKRFIHPLCDWTEPDVWTFIRTHHIPYCSLYDEGVRRIGCIACPLATPTVRHQELRRWPKYERALRYGFQRLWDSRTKTNPAVLARWQDHNAMFDWWVGPTPR